MALRERLCLLLLAPRCLISPKMGKMESRGHISNQNWPGQLCINLYSYMMKPDNRSELIIRINPASRCPHCRSITSCTRAKVSRDRQHYENVRLTTFDCFISVHMISCYQNWNKSFLLTISTSKQSSNIDLSIVTNHTNPRESLGRVADPGDSCPIVTARLVPGASTLPSFIIISR